MLISFKINNFLSFNNEQQFSQIPSIDSSDKFLYKIRAVKVLKKAIILGANSSGKSNLLKAIAIGRNIILNEDIKKYKNYFCKISRDNLSKPTLFEYSFFQNKNFYTYGFTINLNDSKFLSEYLFVHDLGTDQERLVFERIAKDNELEPLFNYKASINPSLKKKLSVYLKEFNNSSESLFISSLINNHELEEIIAFQDVLDYFSNSLSINFFKEDKILHLPLFEKKEEIENLLHYFDTGINTLILEEVNFEKFKKDFKIKNLNCNNPCNYSLKLADSLYTIDVKDEVRVYKVLLKHINAELAFEFFEESDGIRRLFDLLEVLLNPDMNKTYIFDELTKSIHPLLIIKFLALYNERLSSYPVQLIFSTHEANILREDIIRKDEIWFVEKKKNNSSKLYSLDIFKFSDKKLIQAYLDGNYGAVPIFFEG